MIDYTVDILNQNNLGNSFFYLDRLDPTAGFTFDATQFHGPTYPRASSESVPSAAQLTSGSLYTRLLVASHLAGYLRSRLEHQMGYTASAGISTSKLLAKMVGSTHKPNNQTSLLPPYAVAPESGTESSLMNFIDAHEIRKIPGIGSKLAHKLRAYVLAFDPDSNDHLPSPDKKVTVRDIRLFPRMGPVLLEEILGGPGSPKDIGMRVWALIYGVDNSQVIGCRDMPTQISVEDSFRRLEGLENVKKALTLLAASVIRRMRIDLTENAKDLPPHSKPERTWVAYPRTLRLSTRFRSPEETHVRSFNRTSRSVPLPQFVFNLGENVGALAERLVRETLVAMFHKLQPHRSGWNVNLLNVAVTNMVDAAGERKHSSGRDIGKMFRTQETVLEDWKVPEPDYPRCQTGGTDIRSFQPQDQPADVSSYPATELLCKNRGSFDASSLPAWNSPDHIWEDSDEDEAIPSKICPICGTPIPYFAEAAHERYHLVPD